MSCLSCPLFRASSRLAPSAEGQPAYLPPSQGKEKGGGGGHTFRSSFISRHLSHKNSATKNFCSAARPSLSPAFFFLIIGFSRLRLLPSSASHWWIGARCQNSHPGFLASFAGWIGKGEKEGGEKEEGGSGGAEEEYCRRRANMIFYVCWVVRRCINNGLKVRLHVLTHGRATVIFGP